MDKDVIKQKIENVFSNFETAIEKQTDINIKRADGGWSVGEIGNHIVKGTKSNFGATKKTERAYNQNEDSIRDTFLNFNVKLSAPPFLQPDIKQYTTHELITMLESNKVALLKIIDEDDLTETCTDIQLPVWGHLTKYECLVLVENHMIRHTKQVTDFIPKTV